MFNFFGRKKAAPAPSTPINHQADYPEAVTLAARHAQEQQAPFRWLEDRSLTPPTQEELDAMESLDSMSRRHEAELAASIGSLSDLGSARFRTVYSQERTKHSHVSTERMKASMGEERVQEAQQRQEEAQRIFADFLAGKAQPQDVTDAIELCLSQGKKVASSADAQQASVEVGRELAAWRVSDKEPNALILEVHQLAMGKGMDDVYKERTRELPSIPPPLPDPQASRLPFLEKAPFYASRVEKVTFIAGRLGQGTGHLLMDGKILIPGGEFMFSLNAVKSVELATQERISNLSSALGWGVVGASLMGPAGAIVGGLLGGQKEQMTYLVSFSEEHRCLISSSSKVYQKFLGTTL